MDMRGPKGNLTYLGGGNFRIKRRDDRKVGRAGFDEKLGENFALVRAWGGGYASELGMYMELDFIFYISFYGRAVPTSTGVVQLELTLTSIKCGRFSTGSGLAGLPYETNVESPYGRDVPTLASSVFSWS